MAAGPRGRRDRGIRLASGDRSSCASVRGAIRFSAAVPFAGQGTTATIITFFVRDVPAELNSGQRDFLRAPNAYGFLMSSWRFYHGFSLDGTFNLTGPMRVVYEGTQARNEAEKAILAAEGYSLRTTPWFYDLGAKLGYDFHLWGSTFQLYTGVKNLLHSYQDDFDKGAERASSYVYGPMLPRTIYVGFKLSH